MGFNLMDCSAFNIGIIGAGKVGTTLAVALRSAGYNLGPVWSRSESKAVAAASLIGDKSYSVYSMADVAKNSDVIFITTTDDSIKTVAENINWRKGQFVVHCSGAHSLDVLSHASNLGAIPGSFHPCIPFPDFESAIISLPGSIFAIEGEHTVAELLRKMAELLKCESIVLSSGDKPFYHAAAVFVSNFIVAIVDSACTLLEDTGISSETAISMLMPLMESNLKNIGKIGTTAALTGPIVRGDAGIIEKHLDSLSAKKPELKELYIKLAERTVFIAIRRGTLDEKSADKIMYVLKKTNLN